MADRVNGRPIESKVDPAIHLLEKRWEEVLKYPQYRGDNRRVWRVNVRFARLLRDRFDPWMMHWYNLIEQWMEGKVYPNELSIAQEQLFERRNELMRREQAEGVKTDQPFLCTLLAACSFPEATFDMENALYPVWWMAAVGVPVADIGAAIAVEYPEVDA